MRKLIQSNKHKLIVAFSILFLFAHINRTSAFYVINSIKKTGIFSFEDFKSKSQQNTPFQEENSEESSFESESDKEENLNSFEICLDYFIYTKQTLFFLLKCSHQNFISKVHKRPTQQFFILYHSIKIFPFVG